MISEYTRAENNWPVYISRMCWVVMLSQVSIREGESQDSPLRRFQRMAQTGGILREAKAHRHFLSEGETARLKA